jgi:hypothetical protein
VLQPGYSTLLPQSQWHYLLAGIGVAIATYALLVLAILSVREIRGKDYGPPSD